MKNTKEPAAITEQKKRRYISFRSIRFKLNLAVAVGGIILMLLSIWLLSDSMNFVGRDLMDDHLKSELRSARDMFDGEWHLEDGTLYAGELRFGDGKDVGPEAEQKMLHFEEVTGSFLYTFARTFNDDELVWVDDSSIAYQQGHYIRACGTTKGAKGESLVGTYMDKQVADALESEGVYYGDSNVDGTMIYCRYETITDDEGNIIGSIVVGRRIQDLEQLVSKQKTRAIILFFVMLALISAGIGTVVSLMVGAVARIRERLELIGEGVFPEEPLEVRTGDEMEEVAESVNSMVESLREKERIGAELSLATNIQANMLPRIFPAFPDHNEFDIYATMQPAKEVGGDFYDFFMVDDHSIAIVIADVSGKGVPAALFMVIAKTLIKNYAQTGMDPMNVFTRVNQLLCDGNEVSLFVTAWMGILDLETGELTYVNAGHNPPLIKRGNGGFTYLRGRPGFVLAGMDSVRYKQNSIMLDPGDKIFLYTDGVTEAMDSSKNMYGETRLSAYINNHGCDSARDVLVGVKADIDEFVGEAEQFDDITMLMLHYQKRKGRDGIKFIELPARVESLSDATAFVEKELEKADCPMKAAMQINVALEEMFVNVASYAYPVEYGTVRLGVSVGGGSVMLRITDRGIPFDPLACTDPDTSLSAEERDIGGLGIFMVKKTMDEVRYERIKNQNVLTMIKKI